MSKDIFQKELRELYTEYLAAIKDYNQYSREKIYDSIEGFIDWILTGSLR